MKKPSQQSLWQEKMRNLGAKLMNDLQKPEPAPKKKGSFRQKEALLLGIGEWMRDELFMGAVPSHMIQKFNAVRDMCFEALGDPSMADSQRIRQLFEDETKGVQ